MLLKSRTSVLQKILRAKIARTESEEMFEIQAFYEGLELKLFKEILKVNKQHRITGQADNYIVANTTMERRYKN